ncbi:MAG: radical SAM protein [Myxococcales bacterium]
MHVTLINPPFLFHEAEEAVSSQCLGLFSLAGYLLKAGYDVTVVDALFEGRLLPPRPVGTQLLVGLRDADVVSRIPRECDCVGVSVPFTHLAPQCQALVRAIKAARPQTPVVLGGVYPSTEPQVAARESGADYLVVGEGERPMAALLEHLRAKAGGPLPKGVVDCARPELAASVESDRIDFLDDLPLPARHLVPFERYLGQSPRQRRGRRTAALVTSRGCPFDCDFCSIHPVCGRKWRPHSVERVLAEVDELVGRYRADCLEFEDDNFTLQPKRAAAILEGLVRRNEQGAGLTWSTPNGVRIDTLDDGLLGLMKRSGCVSLHLALEHGDPDVLSLMNKRLDLAKALGVICLTQKHRIPTHVFAIVGYPGESRARFENAFAYYREIRRLAPAVRFSFFYAQPYPGTRLLERCEREGYLAERPRFQRYDTESTIWITTPDFDRAEVERRMELLMRTLNPRRYLRQRLMRALPGPTSAALKIASSPQGARMIAALRGVLGRG